jgi:peptide/nickel transport system substrate-binding protein
MPAKYFQQVGPEGFNAKPVGSGPFKFVEWVKGDRLRLDVNRDYWGGAPNASGVLLKPIPEDAPRVAALLTGEADLVDQISPDNASRINTSANAKTVSVPYAGCYGMVLNVTAPPLDNKLVRQALSFAVDRQALVKDLLKGEGLVPKSLIPPGDFAYSASRPDLPFDLNRAKALLQHAGYKGEEVAMLTDKVRQTPTEATAAMWTAAGVNVKIEVVDSSVRSQHFSQKSFKGALVFLLGSAYGDPDGMIFRLMSPGGFINYWNDDEFVKLGQEARSSFNEDLRRRNYERMQDILQNAVPVVPLYHYNNITGIQKTVQWKPNPSGRMEFRKENLSFTS